MKNIEWILLFYLLIPFGCAKKTSNNFDSIDYSYFDGWRNYFSVKVFNSGKIIVLHNNYNDGESIFSFYLNAGNLDSINGLLKKIDFVNLDSTYNQNCEDCVCYNLIVKKGEEVNKIFVEKLENQRTNKVDNLINYLNLIVTDSLKDLSQNLIFNSRTSIFIPIPSWINNRDSLARFHPPLPYDSIAW